MAGAMSVEEYLQKHKIGGLFEELMGRVVSDQPDEPLLFLIHILERKAGRAVQMRSMGDLRDMAVAKSREYDKPWKSNTKRTSGSMKKSTTMPDPKARKSTNLDDLWDNQAGKPLKKTSGPAGRPLSAWKALDDDDIQESSGFEGPRRKVNEDDELAGEFPVVRIKDRESAAQQHTARKPSRKSNPQSDSLKHKQRLEKLILEKRKAASSDSGVEDKGLESDDAVELLEDLEDLKSEGVHKVTSRKGVRVPKSRSRGTGKPEVKISICASCAKVMSGGGVPSQPAEGTQYGELPDFERDSEKESGESRPHSSGASPGLSDEEFESVSQVSGPRRPVWQREDSDSESLSARKGKHMFSTRKTPVKGRPMYSGTMPQPTRSGMDALFQSEDLHRKTKSSTKGLAQTWAADVDSEQSATKGVTFEPGSAQEKDTDEATSEADLVGGATGWQTPAGTDYETDATSSVYDPAQGRKYMGAF